MPRHDGTGPATAGVPEDLLAVVAERYGMHAPLTARWLTGGYGNESQCRRLAARGAGFVADGGGGGRVPPDDDDRVLPLVRAKRILEVLRAPIDRRPRRGLQLANLDPHQALG